MPPLRLFHNTGTLGVPVRFPSDVGLTEASKFAPACIEVAGIPVHVSGAGGYIIGK